MFRNRNFALLLVAYWLISGSGGVKFSIDAQLDQAFKLIELTKMELSDMIVALSPADFNFLVPFGVRIHCSQGSMIAYGMKSFRVHQEDIYMEAISDKESLLSMKFTIDETDFVYDFCWMTLLVPLPIWLRGKILQSTYHVKFHISYEPDCSVNVTSAELYSYEKLSLNLFEWLPGGLGDIVTDVIRRKTQKYIQTVAAKSIEGMALELSSTYDVCMVFPPMGKMNRLERTADDVELGRYESTIGAQEGPSGNVRHFNEILAAISGISKRGASMCTK